MAAPAGYREDKRGQAVVLNEILTLDIYRFFMIFARVATALMMMPGFGGNTFSARVRLGFSMAVTLVLLPVVGTIFPPLPRSVGALMLLVGQEIIIGIYLGIFTQVLMNTMGMASTLIAMQIGLTNAFSYDAIAQQQSTTVTTFFNMIALVAIFSLDLHHLMLRAVVDSYATFVPGQSLPLGDFSETLSHTLSASFGLGVRLASPVLAFSLIFYAGLGLLSRLSPQVQVFFVGLPAQIFVGLWMMMVGMPLLVILFLRWFEDGLIPFLVPR